MLNFNQWYIFTVTDKLCSNKIQLFAENSAVTIIGPNQLQISMEEAENGPPKAAMADLAKKMDEVMETVEVQKTES